MIQPLRRVTHLSITLACGHTVQLDQHLGTLPVLPVSWPCIECAPVPDSKVADFLDGGAPPKLKLVGGT